MTSRIRYNNPRKSQALGLPYHYEMVSDKKRVGAFRRAIDGTCKGRRVLESGAGSAILSILAAKAGAEKVYAVEIDRNIANFAKQNIKNSGYGEKIILIQDDVRNVKPADIGGRKVDVVIAENLSTWQVTEPQIQLMNHINQYLAETYAIRIPEKIYNCIRLSQTEYSFEGVIDLRTYYFEFSGIKKNASMSPAVLFEEISLGRQNPVNVNKSILVETACEGTLNSIRLTSPLQVHRDITFDSSDSLMPPVVFPLKQDIMVKEGDIVELTITYAYNTGWEEFFCEAKSG